MITGTGYAKGISPLLNPESLEALVLACNFAEGSLSAPDEDLDFVKRNVDPLTR